MTKIQEDFKKVARQYKRLKERCTKQVVRWQWATDDMHSLEPFWCERLGQKAGRWLKNPPKRKADKPCYGFDERGRIVVVRTKLDQLREQFLTYDDTHTQQATFDSSGTGKQLRWLERLDLREGRPVAYEIWHEAYHWPMHIVERYGYQNDRIATIDVDRKEMLSKGDVLRDVYREELSYDELARLSKVVAVYEKGSHSYPDGETVVVYERPKKGETLRSLSALAEEQLVSLIPEVVAKAKIRSKVYCLVLGYYTERPLPPCLGIGLESERTAWVKKHGKDVRFLLWNPEEFRHAFVDKLKLDAPEVSRACHLLNEMMREKESCAASRKLLNSVAKRLMQRDWSGELKVTNDFVVVACDIEGQVELAGNFKQSVPKPQLAKLKSNGWI